MANALQTDLKKKNQQDSNQLYVQAQTAGQASAGSANLKQASPAAQAGTAGSTMQGLSGMTQKGLSQYGQQYAPSQAVTEAKDYLNSVMGGQPGSFSSQYAGDIASLYDQIMNRPKFEYDVNKDPLFQQYKNQYVVQGQRAMQDVIGNTAALTGGYGNSWGATAGSQAYQTYLQMLNDRIPELEQRAFDRYTAEGDEMRANMNMATALDTMDYNRYRDTVADWQADRSFAASLYANERSWDQNEWNSMRSYYTQLASLENGDYWTGQNLAENQRQFDLSLEEQKRQADLGDAYKYAALAENARQYDTTFAEDKRLNDRAYNYQIERDQVGDKQWQANYDSNEFWKQKNYDYQINRDAVEDAWNQKLYDQSEQHYQDTRADSQRQWDYNLERDAKQDAWNQKLYDQSEQHYQDSLAENKRQWEHALEREALQDAYNERTWQHNLEREAVEDARWDDTTAYNRSRDEKQDAYNERLWQHNLDREAIEDARWEDETAYNRGRDTVSDSQWQASLDEKKREFNLAHDLDQAEFDFQVQQYMDKLAQLEGSGNGGGTVIPSSQKTEKSTENGSMAVLPVMETNIQGETNYGPLAQTTPAMPAAQANSLISQIEELYQNSIQKKNAEKKAAQTKAKNELEKGKTAGGAGLMASSLGWAALQTAKDRLAKKK